MEGVRAMELVGHVQALRHDTVKTMLGDRGYADAWEPFRIEMQPLRDLDPATAHTIPLLPDTRTDWGAPLGGFDALRLTPSGP